MVVDEREQERNSALECMSASNDRSLIRAWHQGWEVVMHSYQDAKCYKVELYCNRAPIAMTLP